MWRILLYRNNMDVHTLAQYIHSGKLINRFPSKRFAELVYPHALVTEKNSKILRTFASNMYTRDTMSHLRFPASKNQTYITACRKILVLLRNN